MCVTFKKNEISVICVTNIARGKNVWHKNIISSRLGLGRSAACHLLLHPVKHTNLVKLERTLTGERSCFGRSNLAGQKRNLTSPSTYICSYAFHPTSLLAKIEEKNLDGKTQSWTQNLSLVQRVTNYESKSTISAING